MSKIHIRIYTQLLQERHMQDVKRGVLERMVPALGKAEKSELKKFAHIFC